MQCKDGMTPSYILDLILQTLQTRSITFGLHLANHHCTSVSQYHKTIPQPPFSGSALSVCMHKINQLCSCREFLFFALATCGVVGAGCRGEGVDRNVESMQHPAVDPINRARLFSHHHHLFMRPLADLSVRPTFVLLTNPSPSIS